MGHPHITTKVYDFLKQHAQQQFTAQQIAEALQVSSGGVRTACRSMQAAGKAIKETRIGVKHVVFSYTRALHNRSPHLPPAAPAAAAAAVPGNGAAASQVMVSIPVVSGEPVQMSLVAARKLYDELGMLFNK